jgi:hypothetical protein
MRDSSRASDQGDTVALTSEFLVVTPRGRPFYRGILIARAAVAGTATRVLVGLSTANDLIQFGFFDLFQIVDLFHRSIYLRKKSPLA